MQLTAELPYGVAIPPKPFACASSRNTEVCRGQEPLPYLVRADGRESVEWICVDCAHALAVDGNVDDVRMYVGPIPITVPGFHLHNTGGNCTALVRELGRGLMAYLTDEGASAPTSEDEPVVLGIFANDASEPLHQWQSPNVRTALERLARHSIVELDISKDAEPAHEVLANALTLLNARIAEPVAQYDSEFLTDLCAVRDGIDKARRMVGGR